MSSAMLQSVNESPKPSRTLRKQTKLAQIADDSNSLSAEMDLSMDGEYELGDEEQDEGSDYSFELDEGSDGGFGLEDDEGAVSDSDVDEIEEGDIADDLIGEAVTEDGAETTDAAIENDGRFDHVDPSVDSNIQRFRSRLRFVVDKIKSCAEEWDTSRSWRLSPFTKEWHQWWRKVGLDGAVSIYLPALLVPVQQLLGKEVLTRGTLMQLPQPYRDTCIGVYIDVVEKTLSGAVGLYVGSGTGREGLWGRIEGYFAVVGRGHSALKDGSKGNAHMEAIADPNNRMNPRVIAKFAEKTPAAYVLSLETVMILFFDASAWAFWTQTKIGSASTERYPQNKFCRIGRVSLEEQHATTVVTQPKIESPEKRRRGNIGAQQILSYLASRGYVSFVIDTRSRLSPDKLKQAYEELRVLAVEAQARKDASGGETGGSDGPSGDQRPVPTNFPSSAAGKSASAIRTEVPDSDEDNADLLVSSPTNLIDASTFSVDPSEIQNLVPADDSSRFARKGKKTVRSVIPDSEEDEEEEDSFSSSHPRAVPISSVSPSERAGPQTADNSRRSSRKRKRPVRSGMVGWSDQDLE
ncbi:MAG: hypothetical protein Q9226_007859 [Calogaya cf. arnoldii]